MYKYRSWCDASIGVDNIASYAYIIFNNDESVICEHKEIMHFAENINQTEYIVLSELIKKINQMNLKNVAIHIDSLNVFNDLINNIHIGDNLQHLYQILKNEITSSFDIKHIHRVQSSQNKAHNLCKDILNKHTHKKSLAYTKVFSQKQDPKLFSLAKFVVKTYKNKFANYEKINDKAIRKILTRNILLGNEIILSEKDKTYEYVYKNMLIHVENNTITFIDTINSNYEEKENEKKVFNILNRLLKIDKIYQKTGLVEIYN